ncbi:FAD/NAD(P)-binding protein [Streptomyces gobiensis]|uniref:FAD/NAD(P)-binding protein n=1 Tax=Streptomyces gobiensis TaxID=2875706 RepID=UPI001E4B3FA7|nr:FAD/NAD(P)-binding protein [Streptomyces gobiensis]UGY94316.1 FAD/NAD(P)-binding protein [Streptomyces gobiensis]
MELGETSDSVEVGVIGGGAAAVCLLDALAETDAAPGGITVFEPSSHLWRGRPYQPDLETVRVNIAPEGMSVRFGDNGHFRRWLAEQALTVGLSADYEDPYIGTTFVPRAMYGRYLEQSAQQALTRLRQRGWRIDVMRERVAAATATGSGITLRTERGNRSTVNYTVLCVGRGISGDTYSLTGSPDFIADPYPLARSLTGIDADSEVAVVGSGLTGVDGVLSLAARGHRGRILLLSRSGILPMVRQKPSPYTLRHFTPERFRDAAAHGQMLTLDSVIATMRAELAAAGEDFGSVAEEIRAFTDDDPVRRLRRHMAEVDSPSRALRILQHAVPATGPDVWPLLPEHEKDELLRRHYRTVMSMCCPMPPASAATLLDLIDAGQLEILPGVRHIEPLDSGGFTIRVGTGGPEYRTDIVVNAVNAATHRVSAEAEPLVASLTANGLAERHPRGGVRVERATSRLMVNGKTDPRLYALGDLASGSLFFTFGLPSIVDRAYDIVGAIHDDAMAAGSSLAGDDVMQHA